jgi:hypothetical protein
MALPFHPILLQVAKSMLILVVALVLVLRLMCCSFFLPAAEDPFALQLLL